MNKTKIDPITLASWPMLLLTVITLGACSQQAQEKHRKNVQEFEAYVDARRDSVETFVDRNWDELEAEYNQKRAELTKDSAEWVEDVKASYYKAENDWQTFKANYTAKAEERKNLQKMDALRNTLVIEGVRNDYTDLSKENVLKEYQHFVNTVKANKDNYTKEEWTAINVNWQALNGRKREIDKDISTADNTAIVKLQLEYTGIKAVNRPFAENS